MLWQGLGKLGKGLAVPGLCCLGKTSQHFLAVPPQRRQPSLRLVAAGPHPSAGSFWSKRHSVFGFKMQLWLTFRTCAVTPLEPSEGRLVPGSGSSLGVPPGQRSLNEALRRN